MPDPQSDPAHDILAPLSVADPVKAAAWDVYQVQDKPTFEKRLKALKIPNEAKAALWDAKWKPPTTAKPVESKTGITPPKSAPAKQPAKPAGLMDDVRSAWDTLKATTVGGAARVKSGAINLYTGQGGRLHATRDLVEGAMQATIIPATAVLAAGLTSASAPEVLVGLGVGAGLAAGTSALASKFGASEDTAALIGDMAGFLAPGSKTIAGKIRPGGLANISEVAERMTVNDKYKLRLSTPEIATGTTFGTTAKQAQRAIGSTLTGGAVQGAERAAGKENAMAALDQTVRAIAQPGTREQAGVAASEGVASGERVLKGIGKEMGAEAQKANPVMLTADATYQGKTVPAIKPEIQRIFLSDVLPYLKKFPDEAGKAKKLVEYLRDNPGNDTNPAMFGPPVLSEQAQKILRAMPETEETPITSQLKSLYFNDGTDRVNIPELKKKRGQFFRAGKKGDKIIQAGVAKHFTSLLTQHMFATSPEFGAKSTEFRETAQIVRKGVAPLLSKIRDDIKGKNAGKPSLAVDYVARTPEDARMFRKALLDVAAKGPEGPQAKAAYNLVRATYWQEKIVNGLNGKPDLTGMIDRIEKQRPVLKELYGDADGQKLIKTGEEISQAFKSRAPDMQRSMYLIFTVARVLSGAGIGSLATTEASSGLITWLMYNPTMGRVFLNGSKAPDGYGYTALTRVAQAYAAHQAVLQQQRKHQEAK